MEIQRGSAAATACASDRRSALGEALRGSSSESWNALLELRMLDKKLGLERMPAKRLSA